MQKKELGEYTNIRSFIVGQNHAGAKTFKEKSIFHFYVSYSEGKYSTH